MTRFGIVRRARAIAATAIARVAGSPPATVIATGSPRSPAFAGQCLQADAGRWLMPALIACHDAAATAPPRAGAATYPSLKNEPVGFYRACPVLPVNCADCGARAWPGR